MLEMDAGVSMELEDSIVVARLLLKPSETFSDRELDTPPMLPEVSTYKVD